jgi:CheY-like chemotaxis protein
LLPYVNPCQNYLPVEALLFHDCPDTGHGPIRTQTLMDDQRRWPHPGHTNAPEIKENMKQLNCILLIDDDEPTNFLNKMTLEQAGCTRHIRVAQSGQAALEFLRGSRLHNNGSCPRPDLIFLDINMPAMDGWEFLAQYRTLPPEKKADTVLIMLTTSLNPDDEKRTRAIPEVSGFENKPLNQSQLDRLLKKYFNN